MLCIIYYTVVIQLNIALHILLNVALWLKDSEWGSKSQETWVHAIDVTVKKPLMWIAGLWLPFRQQRQFTGQWILI